jgi:DNA-binding MarR family transcriptional regulator
LGPRGGVRTFTALKLKVMTITDLKLTQLEENVLTSLISLLYAEAGYSDVDARDIAKDINVDIKSVRGALGSLVKKNIIEIEDNDGGYQLISLRTEYWALHPEWKNEM